MVRFNFGEQVRCIAATADASGLIMVGNILTVEEGFRFVFRPRDRMGLLRNECFELVTPAEPVRPTRKIVQISTTMSSGECGIIVHGALCDDGTVWECSSNCGWQQIPPIPQPEPTP